ncbi:hypothetical protein A1F97_09928 [Pyrenophora tritici-repentis]|nr:hypothetical protein A1F97_09928 [Pyrenophora tritici-repentis]
MTQAGCYLDDPVGCDRNVPYMNPQCLFSLHERPPMTFELLPLQQPHIDNFAQASLDVLSGFETTDDLELSANPTALRTELKVSQFKKRFIHGPSYIWDFYMLNSDSGAAKLVQCLGSTTEKPSL